MQNPVQVLENLFATQDRTGDPEIVARSWKNGNTG